MNWQKFFTAFIAAFIFLFIFGFLWYGTLMRGAHEEVQALFRTKPDFPWLILGHIVMAFFFTMLCVRFVPAGGIGASAALGILVGLVYAGADLISFAVQPLTTKILWAWIAGSVIQFAFRRDRWRDLQAQITDEPINSNYIQLMKRFILGFIAAYVFIFYKPTSARIALATI